MPSVGETGAARTFMRCWWDCKVTWPLWKIVGSVLNHGTYLPPSHSTRRLTHTAIERFFMQVCTAVLLKQMNG